MKNKLTVFALLIFLFAGISYAQTFYVSTTGNDGTGDGSSGNPWLTIQFAINHASVTPGSTIEVAAGTYAENLTISKAITLISTSGAASTTISAPGGTAINITSSNVTIDGFTITNPLGLVGINANNLSDITIENNIITSIGSSIMNPGSNVFGIIISGTSTPVGNITIQNNTISSIYGGNIAGRTRNATGIAIGFSVGSSTVTNLLIDNNNISDIKGLTSSRGAYGILINYGSSGSGSVVSPSITNNTITDLDAFWAHGIGLETNTPNANVEGNTFSLINATKAYDKYALFFEANPSIGTVTVNQNNFESTHGIGIHTNLLSLLTTEVLNAEVNWWGEISGPSGTGLSGTGAAFGTDASFASIVAHVDFSPWLGAVVGTTPMTYYGNPSDPDYIDEAINNAQDGDEIIVQAGTYNAFTINKSVTLRAEPGTIVNHGSPAIIVAADNVTIDGVTFSYVALDYAIQIDPNYTGTVIVNCNFNVPNAVDNQSNQPVLAENNYWGFNGAYDGPTISTNPGGSGGVISENPGAGPVDYDPWVGKTTTPATGYVGTPITGINISWDWLNFFGPDFDFELDHGGVQGEDLSTTVNTNSITIAGPLLFNTTYNWYVRSQSDPLQTWIGPFSFTTTVDDINLIFPANLSTGIGTSLTFTWSSAPGANDYQIQVDDDPAFGSPFIQTTTGGPTSYAAAGLTPGTTYFWRVRATNNGGITWGPWTASWEFFTTFLSSVANPSQGNYAVGVSVLPTFTWLTVAGATSYDLQVSTDPAFGVLVPLTSSTNILALTYSVTNFEQLTSGTLYYWRVKVNGGLSDGKYSSRWEFTTHNGNLNFTTYYAYGTSVNLAWLLLPYTANVKYDIYLSVDGGFTYTLAPANSNLTATYKTITGLNTGTTYYAIVRAKNNAGTVIISYSAPVSFTTDGLPTPYLSYPIGGATTYSNPPYLYWYTGTLFGGQYRVKYSTSNADIAPADGELDSGTYLALTSNLFTVFPAPLTPGQTYYWQVQCYDGSSYGPWSSVESFVVYSSTPTVAPVPYPSWPVGGYDYYINPPTFFWYTGTFTTGLHFQVQWDDASNFATPLGTSSWFASNLYYTLGAALTPGTYWWRVRSSIDGGTTWSAWSTAESFVIPAATSIVSVPYPTAPVGTIVATLNPTMSWFALTPPALEYRVRISPYSSVDGNGMLNHVTAQSSGWTSSTSIAYNSLPSAPPALIAGVTYYWQVQSRLAAAPFTESSWSYVVSFETAAGATAIIPLVVSPIQGQPINNTSAILTWAPSGQPQTHLKYDVEYSKNADFTNAVKISGVNEPFAKIDGLDKNSKYYWRVSSKNNNGSQSLYSSVGSFSTGNVTSVEPVQQVIPANFELAQNYPNPFNPTTSITYSIPKDNFVSIKVYDMLGREIATLVNDYKNAGNHTINWNGEDNSGQKVASGTYIYRITAGNFVATKKMVLLK